MPVRPRPNPDTLGHRRLFGVLGPSTNTVVQPDFDDLRVPGVTNHYSRIVVDDAQAISDETFMAGTLEISRNTIDAVRGVLTCNPDYLVMGMSAVTFYGGAEGAARWRENIEQEAGLQLCTGSQSLIEAFKAYGGVKRIAVISPYYPSANEQVARFMADHGIEVVRDTCLRCPSWTAIAQVPVANLREELKQLDGDDVDALVQVGTNLSMVKFAAAAELWLGKPVIAINTATYWNALRQNGIMDRKQGFGRLMEEF
ncbi:arylmalonate decarboxylase [Erythrobacter sp. HL-111]|uniref:maleate cis-trans isomerase family protein n=1 Tax=Erythrobacter sp. HL-111 TaxID=1798193 RepID=UPI0006DB6978|nr:arylmalonate decarboxylase [Erythrobacter sp. HL-111]KPP96308.1 MAG: maleate isomerase NicE [Erythrobacteraceae bacterium HL-111]SDR73955.1 maleate isomerase [Erythrobacter sp. HL-111]